MAQSQTERAAHGVVQALKRSKALAEDAVEKSKSIYDSVSERLPEGSTQIAGWVSVGLLVGAVGFLIGRSTGKKEPHSDPGSKADFAPVFKFLKLWMLYRAAL